MTQSTTACVVSSSTNVVENIIVWSDSWEPPEGFYVVVSSKGAIGDTWDRNAAKFIRPEIVQVESTVP